VLVLPRVPADVKESILMGAAGREMIQATLEKIKVPAYLPNLPTYQPTNQPTYLPFHPF
jgi:hypothetical protein